MKPRLTLDAQVALLVALVVLLTLALAAAALRLIDAPGAWLLAGAAALPAALLLSRLLMHPLNRLLTVLADGTRSLREGDFSLSIVSDRNDEIGDLARLYNDLGEILRRERQNLYQRELMLDTVIQTTPLALVLTDEGGRVVYSNGAARLLFWSGRRAEGLRFADALDAAPPELREAVRRDQDGLITVAAAEPEIYQVSGERFTLNAREHRLHLFNRLTRELTRQEVATLKKVIRVLGHELNNSLAPISSLAHSARRLATQGDRPRLDAALATIEDSAGRLRSFLDDYARFAKLPLPRPARVAWAPFLESLRAVAPFALDDEPPPAPGWLDTAQVQQALLNLLKNAHESGSPSAAVTLAVLARPGHCEIRVRDRGPGMGPDVLKSALLPFFSTKPGGTGLGLALCREIAEAHGGKLALANRDGGGLEVTMQLPNPPPDD